MASEKRGHTSKPAQCLLAENGNMGQSPSLIVIPCRHATVTPCLATIEQGIPYDQRKPSCHISDIHRFNSGVLGFDRRTYTQRSSVTGMRRITPSSVNSRTVAPRGLVTYLQLCRPIIPRERVYSSGLRSHIPYIYKTSANHTFKHINLNPGLAVYGVPLGHVQSYSQNVPRVEKVQIHVYLPCDQSEEDISSKFNSLSLQEHKNPEDDKIVTM